MSASKKRDCGRREQSAVHADAVGGLRPYVVDTTSRRRHQLVAARSPSKSKLAAMRLALAGLGASRARALTGGSGGPVGELGSWELGPDLVVHACQHLIDSVCPPSPWPSAWLSCVLGRSATTPPSQVFSPASRQQLRLSNKSNSYILLTSHTWCLEWRNGIFLW